MVRSRSPELELRVVVCYASRNANGSSAKLADHLQSRIGGHAETINIVERQFIGWDSLTPTEVFVIITATHGDQELPDDVEAFLLSLPDDLSRLRYALCELGNYYGYDDYAFGAAQIVDGYLHDRGATRIMEIASIDSLPVMDWRHADAWIDRLNERLAQP